MNFRSDANVLEATNDLFRTLMRREITELDYLPEDELIPAPGRAEGAQVEMHLLNAAPMQADEESEIAFATSLEAEAARCAELIHQLHRQAEPIAYRDMVILMPKVRNLAERVAELLESQGIPVYCDMKGPILICRKFAPCWICCGCWIILCRECAAVYAEIARFSSHRCGISGRPTDRQRSKCAVLCGIYQNHGGGHAAGTALPAGVGTAGDMALPLTRSRFRHFYGKSCRKRAIMPPWAL